MNKFFYLGIIFIAGCSTSSTVESNVKVVETNTAVVNKSIAPAANQPNVNVETSSNGNASPLKDISINEKNVRNWEGKGGGDKNPAPIASNVTKTSVPAPDNSEVSSEMNTKGEPVTTRAFKKHPVLAKIEKTNLDNRNIKVHLKNGKVLNFPEDKANDFLTATANDILKAVGVN